VQGSSSTPVSLAVYGDPIVCRALSLLLEGPDYDVRLLPAAAFSRPGSLEGIQVLLVALGRDTERRELLLASLEDEKGNAKLLILELLAASEERSDLLGEPVRLGISVPWPCSTDVLKRYIEAALSRSPEVTATTNFGS
jgi:hypothetical protein